MTTYIIRYAEIGLKGKNRPDFENQLVANIKKSLGSSVKVVRQHGQILLEATKPQSNKVTKQLEKVFGIAWFAQAHTSKTDIASITKLALNLSKQIKPSESFSIRAHRSTKDLPFTSKDVEIKVGQVVKDQTKAKVDLENPHHTIYIVSSNKQTYLFSQKIKGPGGLPVGTSGKVLSLLSGGFDSIASSYLLAKRGAGVDFLHFHTYPSSKQVTGSKIKTIWSKLAQVTFSNKVYLASYNPFQFAVLNLSQRDQKQELVTFRRHMVRVGEALALAHGYQALVLGDSLGQVASQTMENIIAVDQAVIIPIFRPLIGTDKNEVINLVRKINLEKQATDPYKDCCSIISTHPATKANLKKIEKLESAINADQIAKETVSQTKSLNIS